MARNEDKDKDPNLNPKRPRDRNATPGATLVRVVRTESSEIFIIWQDDTRLGQVDLHFGLDLIHATLILEKDLETEAIAELVDQIDQDIVSSHLPQFAREDFLVTVFRGQELDSFSDGEPDVDDEESEDEY